jgi:hypothetical protein
MNKEVIDSDNINIIRKNTIHTDERLFYNEILYCEGRNKCYFRGKLHLGCLIIFPFLFWIYYDAANQNIKLILIGWTYLLMNFMAYSISAAFHVATWSKSNEIIIQKIDHCFVAIYVTSKYMPMSLLILPPYVGYVHFVSIILICFWNNYNIWHSRPSSWRLVLLAGVQVPFLYFYYKYMTLLEWYCNWIAIISQLIAGYIFINELTLKCFNPRVATFHEIYHFISLITGAAMWVLNYSIIKRMGILENIKEVYE